MPVINFSVPQDVYDKLKSLAIGDESENLAAKRIVLNSLGVEMPVSLPLDVVDRLETLEKKLEQSSPIPSELEKRLTAIEISIEQLWVNDEDPIGSSFNDRITALETAIAQIAESFTNHKQSNAQALEALKDMVLSLVQEPSTEPVQSETLDFLFEPSKPNLNTNKYTIEDSKNFLKDIIESNEKGETSKTKKEVAEYFEIHQYPGPSHPWEWNGNTIRTALKEWGLTWK